MSIIQTQMDALAEFQHMSQDQLDGIAATGNTTLLDGFVKTNDFMECELPCGWKAQYNGCMEPGSVGRILLIPNHEWSRQVWRKGQIKLAVDKGLTELQAKRWISSSVSQRHRLFDLLKATLDNPAHVEGYLDYDIECDNMGALKWSARYGISDNLPLPRRVLFVQLLKDVVGLSGHHGGDEPQDHRPWDIDHAA